MANGTTHLVTEQAKISFIMGTKKATYTFYIMANLPGPLLFGMDWLDKVMGSVDVGMRYINVRTMGIQLPMKIFKPVVYKNINKLFTTDTYVIAPYTSQAVELQTWGEGGKVKKKGLATVFIESEGADMVDKGALTASTVREFEDGIAIVALTNWSPTWVKVPAYSNVASAYFYDEKLEAEMRAAPCFMMDELEKKEEPPKPIPLGPNTGTLKVFRDIQEEV